MAKDGMDGGADRDELVQRLELIEANCVWYLRDVA